MSVLFPRNWATRYKKPRVHLTLQSEHAPLVPLVTAFRVKCQYRREMSHPNPIEWWLSLPVEEASLPPSRGTHSMPSMQAGVPAELAERRRSSAILCCSKSTYDAVLGQSDRLWH